MDMSPANPVRSERKQPQWTVHGSSSLPLADCEDRSSTMSQEAPTAYRVLARKYRPETFAALIGQEALVRTLSNALEMKRLAHAFVLTGVRGIGKTSTARLLAKGLNCIGVNGSGKETLEPCGSCEPCTAIGAGRHVDVLEIDAASHTGVDDAREIIEGVGYRPVSARYKIYIIDEVHMMSKSAFNALLKTLEEPPEAVKFIFATTEIRKVPVTILSRCQRYDLRRVSADMLEEHLQKICDQEGITYDAAALRTIAVAAEGSVRDALSMLDQAAAMTADKLVEGAVNEMLGRPGRGESLGILQAIFAGDAAAALLQFARVHKNGAEAEMVVADLLNIIHQASLAAAGADLADLIESERPGIAALGDLGIAKLGRAWQMLLRGHEEVSKAPNPAAAFEMLVIRLAHTANMPTPGDILQKLPNAPHTRVKETSAATKGSTAPPAESVQQSSAPLEAEPVAHPTTSMHMSGNGGQQQALADNMPPDIESHLAGILPAEAHPGEITPAEPPPKDVAAPSITSLADIATLAEAKDEMLLAARVRTHLRLVALHPGSLEVALTERAPDSLIGDLAKYLTEWTGQRWLVSISDGPGGKTLAEERTEQADALKSEITETPLVKTILTLFPGSKIEAIKPSDAATHNGNLHINAGNEPPMTDGENGE